jgi:hypothetical protein
MDGNLTSLGRAAQMYVGANNLMSDLVLFTNLHLLELRLTLAVPGGGSKDTHTTVVGEEQDCSAFTVVDTLFIL